MKPFLRALLAGGILLAAGQALAQDNRDLKKLNDAVEDYNGGRYARAASAFFEVAEMSGQPELGYRAEYFLALSLFKLGLSHSALYYDKLITDQGPNHPYYQKAVENMLEVMDAVGDRAFIPNMLDREYNPAFAKLPGPVIDRINFLIALWSDRQKRDEESAEFLDAIAKDAPSYARARYLRAVQTARRANSPAQLESAATLFREVLALRNTEKVKYAALEDVQEIATLGLARVQFAQEKFGDSAATYARVPRFARHWRDALFEGAYAYFQKDDYGRALGLLHTLHAPVAGDQLVPESWLLKSYVYFYSCLFEEAKAAIGQMQAKYDPVREQVDLLVKAGLPAEVYFRLMQEGKVGEHVLPAMVRNDLLADESLRGWRSYILALEQESARLKGTDGMDATLKQELLQAVEQQRNFFVQTAGKAAQRQLAQVHATLQDISAQAEIALFEIATRDKDLLELNHDVEARLREQPLYRPAAPPKGIEYWDFEGEYWPDELGFYQFTLKNACRAESAQTAASR